MNEIKFVDNNSELKFEIESEFINIYLKGDSLFVLNQIEKQKLIEFLSK